jgi:hypothetical protein
MSNDSAIDMSEARPIRHQEVRPMRHQEVRPMRHQEARPMRLREAHPVHYPEGDPMRYPRMHPMRYPRMHPMRYQGLRPVHHPEEDMDYYDRQTIKDLFVELMTDEKYDTSVLKYIINKIKVFEYQIQKFLETSPNPELKAIEAQELHAAMDILVAKYNRLAMN